MRLLHFSNDLYPRVTGGSEIFVRQLVDSQLKTSNPPLIRWASHDSLLTNVDHSPDAPLSPEQYLLPPIQTGSRLTRITSQATEIPGFFDLLDDFSPDLVHLHSFSDRCGLSHARAIKNKGCILLITFHSPGFSCIKGNLIDDSGAICDGLLRERRCTRCRLHNGGLSRAVAGAIALQSGWPFTVENESRWAKVITSRQITGAFHHAWSEITQLADGIHVLADWTRDMLINQGIPPNKIRLIRTAGPKPLSSKCRKPMQDGILRLVFWGRCQPVKGLHLLISAIRSLPTDFPIQLDFYGPYWDGIYGQHLQSQIVGDERFCLHGSLSKHELLFRLQSYDLAVIPSTWLETGPLTVLEAFAAGLPVAGSNLGGIRELLHDIPGCFLLPLESSAWMQLFTWLIAHPEALRFLPPKSRDFDELAAEINYFYQDLRSSPL